MEVCEKCQFKIKTKRGLSLHQRSDCRYKKLSYYSRNKEKALKSARRWQSNNRDKVNKKQKEWREKNRKRYLSRMRISSKKWREKNKDKVNANRRSTRAKLRADVLGAYGGICSCCKESNEKFLTIDHINNDGAEHRRSLHPRASAQTLYTWLRRNEYPDRFQVMCYNCNCGRYKNGGICPHKE